MTKLMKTNQENQYFNAQNQIKHLSQLRNYISRSLPHQANSQKFQQQLNIQIDKNFLKYKKQTLQKQRIHLSLQQRHKLQQLNKKRIKQFIQEKISIGEINRKQKLKHMSEKKHLQRLIKESINKNRKQLLEDQQIQKTLKIIQNIQKKQKNLKLPVKLRMLQAQSTSSTDPEKQHELKLLQRYIKGRKQRTQSQMSNHSLQSKIKYLSSNKEDQNTILITAVKQSQFIRGHTSSKSIKSDLSLIPQTIIQKSNSKKSKSLSNLQVNKNDRKNSSVKGQLLKKILEERNDELYNKYLQKKTIAYKAKNLSYHQEIKQIIEKYLKKHIKKLD